MSLGERLRSAVGTTEMHQRQGRIVAFDGLVIEAEGPDATLGELCEIIDREGGTSIRAQVVGFRKEHMLLMPYGSVSGISPRSLVRACGHTLDVPVGAALLGRVVDAFCQPLDDGPALALSDRRALHAAPSNPLRRRGIDRVMETGVRAIDTLLTLGEGQRVGVFAGSGVGKSTLLGMLARHVSADITVLALIGERGREVGDFIHGSLGEGLQRSVVMAATADQPALVRVHAVHAAHAVAEYFRDQGKSVLLVVDSITRFAMAQREIGLAIGEPPTFRGYTPSVFGWLPRIAERCGHWGEGAITAIYSVLVEGDDMNEPIADHMRAILDGHIVLDRGLAARGHHPAIDILQSTSRLLGALATQEEEALASEVRRHLATYEGSRDLVELGAHQRGVNTTLDAAIDLKPKLDAVLRQAAQDAYSRKEALSALRQALDGQHG
ncbi:FliI/YscN family ATPase [Pseudoxanthomonas sp. PXM02]|uniref:FliI/YscN family ATPase n=1 Tax=Pseudoxanthomonas sp. PXM02 TaxID=2769294 RepID=UPI0017839C9F|nr:FliI/YscN family ATPase [Pseudoxanthomonas sp. PXM02]MBD9477419.1 FliI/YscN family ATPase [Pseudoxanthomonas sp. PXM02]